MMSLPRTPEDYRVARAARGTQTEVAAALEVTKMTIYRRETGEVPISKEAALALLSLPLKKARKP